METNRSLNNPLIAQGILEFSQTNATLYEPDESSAAALPWIVVKKGHPYFFTERGRSWTPVGQNDAITWPDLKGAFMGKDLAAVETYLDKLVDAGVTCLRLMLEYCQGEHRYLEKPVGYFQPHMVTLWDMLFALCEKKGLRILLTPYDTFWMWRRWARHPYRHTNGGPCAKRTAWLCCPRTRNAIKNRLTFATQRWGRSGALFAWDLWNEIHPAHSGNSHHPFYEFITDLSQHLRKTEQTLYGRSHLQTVSFFLPTLAKHPLVSDCAFDHPALDFATLHFYEQHTIDNPKNTIDAAVATGRLVRQALHQIKDNRPFFDSEHGPIKKFSNRRPLPEPFDDEYFRHMQWAHLAAGGAGGGMRWPYRHPHSLTPGMRRAQKGMAGFLALLDWTGFNRRNLNEEVLFSDPELAVFACGDATQAVIWLLRAGAVKRGPLRKNTRAKSCTISVPLLQPGTYTVTCWDTVSGVAMETFFLNHSSSQVLPVSLPPVYTDLAIAIKRIAG
ncbi:MAG TPA: hypothetical protein VM010_05345 [Chitinophagaceae bacterium]|nr:hypothetical protein [Chitinophagaceae bacterium]